MSIQVHRIEQFVGGWFVGNFVPSLFRSKEIELGFKHFEAGDTEPEHFQCESTELTFVVKGDCRIGDRKLGAGDIAQIPPGLSASFEAFSGVDLIVVKFPSTPEDKFLGKGNISLG